MPYRPAPEGSGALLRHYAEPLTGAFSLILPAWTQVPILVPDYFSRCILISNSA